MCDKQWLAQPYLLQGREQLMCVHNLTRRRVLRYIILPRYVLRPMD